MAVETFTLELGRCTREAGPSWVAGSAIERCRTVSVDACPECAPDNDSIMRELFALMARGA